jgi:TolB-like protein
MRCLLALALAATLAACATGQAARLPDNPGWIGGQAVSVEGPRSVGVGGPELAAQYLHDGVEADLRSAGFSVGTDSSGLSIVIELFERSQVKAQVSSGGREVQRIDLNGDALGCVSAAWGLYASDNAQCYSRALVSAMMRSEQVARAAGPPVKAVAQQQSRPQESFAAQSETQQQPRPQESFASQDRRVLQLRGKLAVLDLKNFTKDLTHQNAQYFSDVIRQASLRMEPGLDIMTRENLLVLLQSTGKKLEECEGECEVDTGRRIGADHIVSGEIQKVGSKYKLTLRLHDTHQGKLLASAIGSGKSIDELDESAQKAAEELFTLR